MTDDKPNEHWKEYWDAVGKRRKEKKEKRGKSKKSKKQSKREQRKRKTHYFIKQIKAGKLKGGSNTKRNSLQYYAWRQIVLERDGYKCVHCGSTKRLHVHHCVESWANCPSRRLDPTNGETVCKKCHAKIHPFMNKFVPKKVEKQQKQNQTISVEAIQGYVDHWVKVIKQNPCKSNYRQLDRWRAELLVAKTKLREQAEAEKLRKP